MLAAASIFPTQQFLRYGNQPQANNSCGGVASLIVIGILLALFGFKMFQANSKEMVFVSQHNKYTFRAQMVTLTTNFSDTQNVPFMLAVASNNFAALEANLTDTQLQINLTYLHYSNALNKKTKDVFKMVPCTQDHFVVFQELRKYIKGDQRITNNIKCLPLNQNYRIGGDFFAEQFGHLYIEASPGKNQTGKSGGNILIYESNSLIDPHLKTQPQSHSFKARYFFLAPGNKYQYVNTLKKQTLQSDQSLTPFEDITEYNIVSLEQNIQIYGPQQLQNKDSFLLSGRYQISTQQTLFKRHYFKYADVISYVGGYFSPIIALFFFMSYIGEFHFEMSFAKKSFRKKEGNSNGFGSFLKYNFYKLLAAVGKQPQWQLQKKQLQLRCATNKVLNINYLFQRIDFLQKAMTILFDRHHLKGLYLVHKASVEETNKSYKDHQYRDEIVKFLYDKRVRNANKKEKSILLGLPVRRKSGLKPNKNLDKKARRQSAETMYSHTHTNTALSISGEVIQKDQLKVDNLEENLPDIFPQINLVTRARQRESISSSYRQSYDPLTQKRKKREYLAELAQEMEMLKDDDFEEAVDTEAMNELRQDFLRLVEEAESHDGDERSKRIYGSLDEWLKGLIRLQLEENQKLETPLRRTSI